MTYKGTKHQGRGLESQQLSWNSGLGSPQLWKLEGVISSPLVYGRNQPPCHRVMCVGTEERDRSIVEVSHPHALKGLSQPAQPLREFLSQAFAIPYRGPSKPRGTHSTRNIPRITTLLKSDKSK